MEPLNNCLHYYQEQKRQNVTSNTPTYLVFHDTDEYIFPVDTNLTILEALDKYRADCCSRVGGRCIFTLLHLRVQRAFVSGWQCGLQHSRRPVAITSFFVFLKARSSSFAM